MIFETGNGCSDCILQTEPNTVLVGRWNHVAVVVDCANAAAWLYLNGVPVPASGCVRNDFATHRPIYIGCFVDGHFHLQGEMDDVRIYSALLPPVEVAVLAK